MKHALNLFILLATALLLIEAVPIGGSGDIYSTVYQETGNHGNESIMNVWLRRVNYILREDQNQNSVCLLIVIIIGNSTIEESPTLTVEDCSSSPKFVLASPDAFDDGNLSWSGQHRNVPCVKWIEHYSDST
jgi:hypothetical protein